ncbi:sigma factor-like helix-turn-helix DNA-binding protein [Saccharothrix texasensis]|uniref:sigma factor-like helix-turn-helix DNA-binding protein n=1 Tax=Saccharothrix texasensis TaxID=103734 RepID=UPI000F4CE0CA|nr:sigma factor-like helix-turn-helix DNA-binding protein [Saccharothrix texasensis]
MPDTGTRDDVAGDVVVRLAVRARLARLSVRQRAVVVLRSFEDRSVQDATRVVGCSGRTPCRSCRSPTGWRRWAAGPARA